MSDEREYITALTVQADGTITYEFDTLGKSAIREQVVRCRDCKYATDEGYGCKWFSHYEQRASYRWEDVPAEVDPNGFCAWGKRRDA